MCSQLWFFCAKFSVSVCLILQVFTNFKVIWYLMIKWLFYFAGGISSHIVITVYYALYCLFGLNPFPHSHKIMNLWPWILSCTFQIRKVKTFDPWTEELTDDKLPQPLVVKVSEGKIGADRNYEGPGIGRNLSLRSLTEHIPIIFNIHFLLQLHKCNYFC